MFDDQSISIPKKTRHMCFDTESIESRESPMKLKFMAGQSYKIP